MSPDNYQNEEVGKERFEEHNHNNILTGVFLLLIGAGVLLKNMETGIPDWVFSWEVLMLAGGLYLGIRHRFRGPLWFILVLISVLTLQDNLIPDLHLRQYTWPIILMVLGLYFIVRPKASTRIKRDRRRYRNEELEPVNYTPNNTHASDRLDITTIFGNIKKVVVSKDFKGGEIVSFMGGSDINLSQADIQGRVHLETTNFMGGTKLIVPANWNVQSELVAIFGGVEDKRDMHAVTIDQDKVLILEGTCIFGGIEIKSY